MAPSHANYVLVCTTIYYMKKAKEGWIDSSSISKYRAAGVAPPGPPGPLTTPVPQVDVDPYFCALLLFFFFSLVQDGVKRAVVAAVFRFYFWEV